MGKFQAREREKFFNLFFGQPQRKTKHDHITLIDFL